MAVESKKWDLAGIGLSVLCGIHCLSVPLLMSALPLMGLGFLAGHEFEWVMMSIIFVVAGQAFWRGYRRHKRHEVFWFLGLGVVVFALVRPWLPEAYHPVATLSGGLIFIAGHWKNWHWHRADCRKACCAD